MAQSYTHERSLNTESSALRANQKLWRQTAGFPQTKEAFQRRLKLLFAYSLLGFRNENAINLPNWLQITATPKRALRRFHQIAEKEECYDWRNTIHAAHVKTSMAPHDWSRPKIIFWTLQDSFEGVRLGGQYSRNLMIRYGVFVAVFSVMWLW